MSRPKEPDPRVVVVKSHVTAGDRLELGRRAHLAGLSVSEYLRRRALRGDGRESRRSAASVQGAMRRRTAWLAMPREQVNLRLRDGELERIRATAAASGKDVSSFLRDLAEAERERLERLE